VKKYESIFYGSENILNSNLSKFNNFDRSIMVKPTCIIF